MTRCKRHRPSPPLQLPGINPNGLGDPLALYNLLTGRVASANFTRVVNPETLKYDGVQEQNFTWTNSIMGGLYAQDRWRITAEPDVELRVALGGSRPDEGWQGDYGVAGSG